MVQVRVLFWVLQLYRTIQKQLTVQMALCCALFLLLTGAWREQMDESKAWLWGCFGMLWVVSVRQGPAWPGVGPRAGLGGWCEQPAADWSPVAPPPYSVQAFTELFLSQPGATWAEKISGLPEQLIHPTVYSLLTHFLRIPTAQAAQMQAGWAAGAWSLGSACASGRVRQGKPFPQGAPQPSPSTGIRHSRPWNPWAPEAPLGSRAPRC